MKYYLKLDTEISQRELIENLALSKEERFTSYDILESYIKICKDVPHYVNEIIIRVVLNSMRDKGLLIKSYGKFISLEKEGLN